MLPLIPLPLLPSSLPSLAALCIDAKIKAGATADVSSNMLELITNEDLFAATLHALVEPPFNIEDFKRAVNLCASSKKNTERCVRLRWKPLAITMGWADEIRRVDLGLWNDKDKAIALASKVIERVRTFMLLWDELHTLDDTKATLSIVINQRSHVTLQRDIPGRMQHTGALPMYKYEDELQMKIATKDKNDGSVKDFDEGAFNNQSAMIILRRILKVALKSLIFDGQRSRRAFNSMQNFDGMKLFRDWTEDGMRVSNLWQPPPTFIGVAVEYLGGGPVNTCVSKSATVRYNFSRANLAAVRATIN
jgi:hypothetical protein